MPLRSTEAPTLSAPAQRTADPLAALRQATQERHARLDAHLPIARPDAQLRDYAQHARALSGWLAALAPELRALQTQAPGFAFDDPARLAALQADLQDADLNGAPSDVASVPCSTATLDTLQQALQTVPTQVTAFRWGLAYVVEGSQLGGQVLHRRLAPRLAPHPLRYLQGSGGNTTGARWREFVERLRDQVRSPDAVQAACAGAAAAFDGLERDLRAAGAPL
ncbi:MULTISPECIES: biliverdin-producing heme oxygenase [unclassified Acidovorax]|uniref:biliverdin-producing heme oxygenase n=1 Tax=unclassified Acidovorax TaxID=2684926 RepID=UPI0028834245|nr:MULTISPECIES: biliverdin-producing heme oxygenase [unclassified Acidovorax]